MNFKEAHDWCLKHGATVYFHPEEAMDGKGIPTIGRVQFSFKSGGSAGDSLPDAIENWVYHNECHPENDDRPEKSERECNCNNPQYLLGPCLNCGGLMPLY